MRMLLGPTVFNMITNPQDLEAAIESRFAEHKVLGGDILFEKVGAGRSDFSINGVIYPERLGTDGGITKLKNAQSLQLPLPLMRGDFRPMGWVIIRRIHVSEKKLNNRAIGRKITFKIDLSITGKPSGNVLARTIIGFLS